MQMNLKKLISKRGVMRATVTKLCQQELFEEHDMNKMKQNREELLRIKKTLEDLDLEIADQLNEEENLEKEFQETYEYENKINRAIVSLNLEIQRINNEDDRQSEGESVSTMRSSNERIMTAKLPQLKITPFNGNPLKWQEFWDSFESIIHNEDSFSPVVKFNYLLMFLEADAKKTVEGLSVTNKNYKIALDILKERFGQKEFVIFAHLGKIFSMPAAPDETAKLRNTIDDCERHIRSLETFGSLTADQIFAPLILSKLPQNLRISLHRKNGSKAWDLATLRRAIKDEISARELGERHFGEKNNTNEKPERNISSYDRGQSFGKTHEALVAESIERKPCCVFCYDEHYSDQCQKYSDVKSRKAKLERRCFSCLGKNHTMAMCYYKKKCVYCKKLHHRSLCPKRFGKVEMDFKDENESKEAMKVAVEKGKGIKARTQNATLENRIVLSQTATTVVNNPSLPLKEAPIRILLDTGSSCSFISEKIMKHLKLKPVGYEDISVATFAERKSKRLQCPMVEVSLHQKDKRKKKIIANVLPVISCSKKRTYIDQSHFPQLKDKMLADSRKTYDGKEEIDMLIGNDFYYEFVKEERLKLDEGLVALDTVFGWIPSGRILKDYAKKQENNKIAIKSEDNSVQCALHCFVDASRKVYTAVKNMSVKEAERMMQPQHRKHFRGRLNIKEKRSLKKRNQWRSTPSGV